MAKTLVATNLDLAADICLNLATEVTLDLPGCFDNVTQSSDLLVGEVVGAQVGRDAGLFQQLGGTGGADAVNVSECNLHALIAREVHTS